MSKKAVSVIKHSIALFCLACLICAISLFFLTLEFDASFIFHFGIEILCFFILPIAAFLVPIIIKLIKKTSFKSFLCSALLSLLVYSLILLTVRFSCYVYLGQFTPEKWEKHYLYRNFMFEDLQKDYQLQGMTKDELEKLLGKPLSSNENELVYYYSYSFLDETNIYFVFENEKVSYWHFDLGDPNPPPFFGRW